MLRELKDCGCVCGCVCLCLGAAAVVAGELHEFERPSQLLCEKTPLIRDLGTPERCGGDPAPHNRRNFMTANSVSSTADAVLLGSITITITDAEEAAEIPDRRFAFSGLPISDVKSPAGHIADRMPVFVIWHGKLPPRQVT
jgi:hypothetical protein